jgi:hypothetical protein
VELGETVMLAPLEPLLHEYVLTPLALKVELPPIQIVLGEAFAETFGTEFTVIDIDAVFEHPSALIPVTVYVVVLVGDTVLEVPLPKLCDQVYVFAPFAVSVALSPVHN